LVSLQAKQRNLKRISINQLSLQKLQTDLKDAQIAAVFAIHNLGLPEVNILDAQAQAFHTCTCATSQVQVSSAVRSRRAGVPSFGADHPSRSIPGSLRFSKELSANAGRA